MKTCEKRMKVSVLSLAVQGALAAMCATPMLAQAADEAVTALTQPTSSIEVGVGNVSKKSAKFGEYNGLNDSGTYGVANFSVRGGDAYNGGTGDGTMFWGMNGTDLGTTSRELDATIGNQGRWIVNIGQDELRHNITDSYQTPQQGVMGGNSFTFPPNFGTINAAVAPIVLPSARVLNPTQLGAFHTEEVGTTRKNTSFGAGFNFDRQWSVKFDYNHLDQTGAKLLGTSSLGGVATPFGGGTWRAEGINIAMNPTNYKTDSFNLALNWVGDKGHLTGGYYGSIFRDGYDRFSLQNAFTSNGTGACASDGFCTYQTTTMSTAPDNSLHQLNLSGGYAFSPATKLAGSLSYGRNTQDNSYLTGLPTLPIIAPRASLDGLVVTTHADLKLTNQTSKDLTLSAGFKFNERENRSSSDRYQFFALNSSDAVIPIVGIDTATNAPYSNRKSQIELAADYRLGKGQNVRLAYEHEDIKRWCKDYAIAGSNCLVNPGNKEDKLGLNYRVKAGENVKLNAGYTYAKRNAEFDGNAITPLAGLNVDSLTLVNAQNFPGYIAYPYAKRQQHLLKAGVNWQANDKLDLGLNGRFVKDNYDATLGVQDGRTVGINLDATYAYTENSSVSAYASWQKSERDLTAGAAGGVGDNTATSYAALVAPTNIWTNQLKEDSNAIGISTKHKGLMGGKLELLSNLSYSRDTSTYSTQVPFAANCATPAVLTCGDTPDIKNRLIMFKLGGIYNLDKKSRIALGYIYQKLTSNDYVYNGEQFGFTPNRVMPTNQVAPNYAVNVFTATYIYTF